MKLTEKYRMAGMIEDPVMREIECELVHWSNELAIARYALECMRETEDIMDEAYVKRVERHAKMLRSAYTDFQIAERMVEMLTRIKEKGETNE